jgi:Sulfotransferase domain
VVVLDGDQVLADPRASLSALCATLGIGWTEAMLSWPAGRRATDGVWAPHWYGAVEASTGFGPPAADPPVVPERLRWVVDAVRPAYEELRAGRLPTS